MTTENILQIGVENEEKLFVCTPKKPENTIVIPENDVVNITLTVIDVNDPPSFVKKVTDVYLREEDEPGLKLFEPQISDQDSPVDEIKWVALHARLFNTTQPLSFPLFMTLFSLPCCITRYTLLEDLAGWARIDPKTGIVHSVQKMDRESPFVDKSNIYRIVVAAIDNGMRYARRLAT